MRSFLDTVAERVVVYDGATGTWLQTQDLSLDDYGGPAFEGCTDILGVTRPDVIAALHTAYFEVGADVVETNTFGAFGVPLGEYDIAERAHEIAPGQRPHRPRGGRRLLDARPPPLRGRLARSRHQGPVAGPDPLRRAPRPLRGGRRGPARGRRRPLHPRDPLRPARREGGRHRRPPGHGRRWAARCPIQCQVTMELTGRMLARHRDRRRPGRHRPAEGRHHRPQLRHRPDRDERAPPPPLASTAARARSPCLPNAGLPSVVDGKMHYDLHARAAARPPAPLRRGARRPGHRRLLRHHAGVHQAARRHGARTSRRPPARSTHEPSVDLDLLGGAARAGRCRS